MKKEKINVAELYKETLDNMRAVLAGKLVVFEVYHLKFDGKNTNKVQHQSVYVDAVDPEQALYKHFSDKSIDFSELIYRPYALEEVDEKLDKLYNELHPST